MKKPIAIIAGEPNSISSEIIFKSWKYRNNYKHKPFFIIGNFQLLNLQMKRLKYNIKIKKIDKIFNIKNLPKNELHVYDVKYTQKKPFKNISSRSNRYVIKCFDIASQLANKKRIIGFINCPIAKEFLFKNKHQGITEYLSKKENVKNDGVMLIFNNELSVSPITKHISINQVSNKINQLEIVSKIKIINNFYKKYFLKKPNFALLSLNPHNYYDSKESKIKEKINVAIKILKKQKINIKGPIPADSSFMVFKKYKFDVIIGMYHDQVLTPFKALYNFKAINITLGLPYIRISPDHGVGQDIMGMKIANPDSLIESIKFFNCIK
jgi:4-hydroxythreonine-4-phosphate dehydrogenase